MIDIASAIPTMLTKLKKLPNGHSLVAKTFKKDRSITVVKQEDDRFLVQEQGFEDQELMVQGAGLKKVLKKLFKREFPRSNKVWLSSEG